MIEVLDDGTMVSYLTNDLQPAPKARAPVVKMVAPDGTVTFGRRVADQATPPVREHYSPDQPRDPAGSATGGQWTGEGGDTSGTDLGYPTGPAMSREIRLRRFEDTVAHNAFESALVLAPDGSTLVEKRGGRAQVEFTPQEVARMAGATLSHNHPKGSSFSLDDIHLAVVHGLAEMRVVTSGYEYSMTPGSKGWPSKDHLSSVHRTVSNTQAELWGNRIRSGEITVEWANANHFDELWTTIVKSMPDHLVYRKEARHAAAA